MTTRADSVSLQFSDEQRQVIDSRSRAVLVLGGAGCGKTTAALATARRHLRESDAAEQPIGERRVLFVTFSRTAVEQIRDRSAGVLTDEGDRIEIATFHGLAFRLDRAFGRYFGGEHEPTLVSDARSRLLGTQQRHLTYSELIPRALRIVQSETAIARLISNRWSLVICDEFQDTDDAEWQLLQAVSPNARIILLADPNQMIYSGFKPGVDLSRLDSARAVPDCLEIELPPQSHRDPTQILPAAALAVRHRHFDDKSIGRALDEGRLVISTGVPDDLDLRAQRIATELAGCRDDGLLSCGVYVKTNADAAGMSEALLGLGVRHVPVGFSEAFGESLEAQLVLAKFGGGEATWTEVVEALAVVATANVRKKDPPRLARLLASQQPISREFDRRLLELRGNLESARTIDGALEVAVHAWSTLGITPGEREWERAGRILTSLFHRTPSVHSGGLVSLENEVARLRIDSLVTSDRGRSHRIQLMNFSQTKGREADAVILSYSSSDYYGSATEPFDEASRIVYVSMTRARHRVIVLLPDEPHELVAPLAELAR